MPIIITNVTERDDDSPDQYVVRINDKASIATFEHHRSKGLAACLRRAADAVERAEKERGF